MVMKYFKTAYIILTIIYFLVIAIYLIRYEVSYRIVNARPEIVKVRDLTNKEYIGLEKAQRIRNNISKFLFYFSLFTSLVSAALWYFKPFDITTYLKSIFFISLIITVILFLIDGIKFIPTAPIR